MTKPTTAGRLLSVTLLTAALAVGGPVASAEPAPASASASVGSVDVEIGDEHVATGELAPCDADGPSTAKTAGGSIGDFARFNGGESRCGRTGAVAVGEATGRRFETTLLKRFGGPVIKVRTFMAKCSTTKDGSLGYIEFGDVTGFTLPENIPQNYRLTIAGGKGGTALASLTVNETVTPTPPDGSLVTHMLHIKLFPQGGGPAKGDIYLGTARCDPYGKKP
ncbi:choice-of-anchor P family protein [Amycolatopsis orientalis]|uniref:choice-of-anchor P family protein n=1 Tax=Amycolatopsis orientalis TaxID=31958 RepID=UPI0003F95131|nr:choice-of-anchor P family protein [Amycolatopsis orientalis]